MNPKKTDPLLEHIRDEVLAAGARFEPSLVATAIHASGQVLGISGSLAAAERINAELIGLGPLQKLLADPELTDIFVNSPSSVWVKRRDGLERCAVEFSDESQVRALARRLITSAGSRLDDGQPFVDVRLPGGLRVHAVLPPVSGQGTLLSIRLHRARPFELNELIGSGMISTAAAQLLREAVSARLNLLISGATGSGKTTLLNTVLGLRPEFERLVLIEDTAELKPNHAHVLALQSRAVNLEGKGKVDLSQLVREALRMNPSRLFIGECRGAEIQDFFTALNTGHSGAGTIHANSAVDVPARLQALGALAGMSSDAVGIQAASAIDVVLHLENTGHGRVLREIGLLSLDNGKLCVEIAAVCGNSGLESGPAWRRLQRRLTP